jgi:hypothetical protein
MAKGVPTEVVFGRKLIIIFRFLTSAAPDEAELELFNRGFAFSISLSRLVVRIIPDLIT